MNIIGMVMHRLRRERPLSVSHNFVTVPNKIGWNNARVLQSLHSRLPHRVGELHRAQAHTTKV